MIASQAHAFRRKAAVLVAALAMMFAMGAVDAPPAHASPDCVWTTQTLSLGGRVTNSTYDPCYWVRVKIVYSHQLNGGCCVTEYGPKAYVGGTSSEKTAPSGSYNLSRYWQVNIGGLTYTGGF